MMTRKESGYITDKIPETAVYVKNQKYMIIPSEGCLPEYSPEGFNKVLYYFKEKLELNPFVDNLNNQEWLEASKGMIKTEIKNRAFVSYSENNRQFTEELMQKISKDISESETKIFKDDLKYATILSVCIEKNGSTINFELPYCTVEKICNFAGDISI